MRIPDACKNYFKGFHEISQCKNNTKTKNLLATLKICSYITLIIPVAVLGIGCLYGRISKKSTPSTQDQKVQVQANPILLSLSLPATTPIAPSFPPQSPPLTQAPSAPSQTSISSSSGLPNPPPLAQPVTPADGDDWSAQDWEDAAEDIRRQGPAVYTAPPDWHG